MVREFVYYSINDDFICLGYYNENQSWESIADIFPDIVFLDCVDTENLYYIGEV